MKKSIAVRKLEKGQDLRSLGWLKKHRYVKRNKQRTLVLTRKGVGYLNYMEKRLGWR